MKPISRLNINELGAFAPMLTKALEDSPEGTPILLGYTKDEKAVGALAAVETEELILLRWVVVEEEYRRQGIGSELLEMLEQYADAKKTDEIGSVICLSSEEERRVDNFLKKGNFQLTEENTMFSVPLSDIVNGPLKPHINKELHANVKPINDISKVQLQEFNFSILSEEGFAHIHPDEILADCSFVWLEKGTITGCVLVAPCGEDIELQLLYAQKPLAVPELISAAATVALHKFGTENDTQIFAASMQPSVEKMLKKLGGNKVKEEQTIKLYQYFL